MSFNVDKSAETSADLSGRVNRLPAVADFSATAIAFGMIFSCNQDAIHGHSYMKLERLDTPSTVVEKIWKGKIATPGMTFGQLFSISQGGSQSVNYQTSTYGTANDIATIVLVPGTYKLTRDYNGGLGLSCMVGISQDLYPISNNAAGQMDALMQTTYGQALVINGKGGGGVSDVVTFEIV